MAKKKKQKKQQKQKPQSNGVPTVVHHLIAVKDIAAWGSGTMCGARAKSGSVDHTKVTCDQCAKYTNWNVDKYRDACSEPIKVNP